MHLIHLMSSRSSIIKTVYAKRKRITKTQSVALNQNGAKWYVLTQHDYATTICYNNLPNKEITHCWRKSCWPEASGKVNKTMIQEMLSRYPGCQVYAMCLGCKPENSCMIFYDAGTRCTFPARPPQIKIETSLLASFPASVVFRIEVLRLNSNQSAQSTT